MGTGSWQVQSPSARRPTLLREGPQLTPKSLDQPVTLCLGIQHIDNFRRDQRVASLNLAVMLRSFAIVLGDFTTCLQVSSPYLPDWVTAFTHDPALGFRVARPKTTRT